MGNRSFRTQVNLYPVDSSIKALLGAHLFQAHLRGVGGGA